MQCDWGDANPRPSSRRFCERPRDEPAEACRRAACQYRENRCLDSTAARQSATKTPTCCCCWAPGTHLLSHHHPYMLFRFIRAEKRHWRLVRLPISSILALHRYHGSCNTMRAARSNEHNASCGEYHLQAAPDSRSLFSRRRYYARQHRPNLLKKEKSLS